MAVMNTTEARESDSQRAAIWIAEMGTATALRDWAHVQELAHAVSTVAARLEMSS
jgi:hypothetical protein